MDVSAIADELYGLPVEAFTETRNDRAKELSASGEAAAAAEVRTLRKPSQAAWLANRLVRRHRHEIETLLALGRDLRRAQDRGDGADLRRLSTDRQAMVRHMIDLASAEAKTAGTTFGPELQRQLVATVEAAMADESSGAALAAGRLSVALSHVGFGGAGGGPAPDGVSGTTGRRASPAKGRSGAGEARPSSGAGDRPTTERRDAERAVEAARRTLRQADATLLKARRLHDAEMARQREATEALRRTRQALETSSQELRDAVDRQKKADRSLREAERHQRAASR